MGAASTACGGAPFGPTVLLTALWALPRCRSERVRVVTMSEEYCRHASFYCRELPRSILAHARTDLTNDTFEERFEATSAAEALQLLWNGTADLMCGYFWALPDVNADFTHPMWYDSLVLAYMAPPLGGGWFSGLLAPFDTEMWAVIFAFVPAAALLLILAELPHPTARDGRNEIVAAGRPWRTLRLALGMVAKAPLGGTPTQPRSALGKLWHYLIRIFFLLVVTVYTANLASYLTVARSRATPSRAELLAGRVGYLNHDSVRAILLRFGPQELVPFDDGGGDGYTTRGVAAVRRGELRAMVVSGLLFNALQSDPANCDLAAVPLGGGLGDISNHGVLPVVMVAARSPAMVPVTRRLSDWLLEAEAAGTLGALIRVGQPQRASCAANGYTNEQSAVRPDMFLGVFTVLGALAAVIAAKAAWHRCGPPGGCGGGGAGGGVPTSAAEPAGAELEEAAEAGPAWETAAPAPQDGKGVPLLALRAS